MKILLIGHSIIDHFAGDDIDTAKPGGIFYSALAMCSVIKPGDELFLLTGFNKKSFHLFERVYSKTNMEFSSPFDEMPEVILKTSGQGEREEIYKNISFSLSFDKIKNWNMFDVILINMVTGFDISVEQLSAIRKNFSGKIYFDVHTLSRGVDESMQRIFRPVPDVEKWLANIDIIQCNEIELKTISKSSDEFDCAREILACGSKILIITKGGKGSSVYFLKDGKIQLLNCEAEKVVAVNKIGCGDVFGAVFFYFYISKNDVNYSLRRANNAGALTAAHNNLINLTRIGIDD
jgi:hypothetical protein